MNIYKHDIKVNQKNDFSPLTEADLLSDKIITNSLKEFTPEIQVLSEESLNISMSDRLSWKEYWLIDPLDGTKEFIKKNDEFTTNIALIRDNQPVLGVVHAPALNETYWGAEGLGAFFLRGDDLSVAKSIQTSVNYDSSDSVLRIATSRSHPSDELETFLTKLGHFELLNIGSSLKFCLIAKGELDLYPRFGPTSEWDTAAGQAILQSAGGLVTDSDGSTLKYNSKESLLNPNFVACSNKKIYEKIITKVKL